MYVPTILVVDADPAIRDVMGDLLREEGFRVQLREERELLPCRVAAERPDLVFLEIPPGEAPETLAIIEQLRCQPSMGGLPVIISTTDPRLLEGLGVKLRQLCCATMIKPFELDQLLALVHEQLSTEGSRERA